MILGELERRLATLHPGPRIARSRHELSTLEARRDNAMRELLDERRAELAQLGAQMAALSPLAVLDRGYAMVRAGDVIVRDAAQVHEKERLHVKLARGSIDVIVTKIQKGSDGE
jgi:exodeoxyribonuclease VII large subunit